MIEMTSRQMSDNIISELGHEPTAGQMTVIEMLSEFISAPHEPYKKPAFFTEGICRYR